MRHYETTFVIDSLLKAEEIDAIIGKYERFITTNGGEILRIDRWGKRRLAFEIKKRQYGFYVYVRFMGPSNIPKLIEREYRLNENVLRYLTLVLDKKALAQEAKNLKEMKAASPRSDYQAPDNNPEPELILVDEVSEKSDLSEKEPELTDSETGTETATAPVVEPDASASTEASEADTELTAPKEQNTVSESEIPVEPKPE